MSAKEAVKLTKEQVSAIEKILASGNRVEVYPGKDGVQIIKILRHNMRIPAQK